MDSNSSEVALLSIHPRFAEAILTGEKRVEFRRTKFSRDVSHIANFLASVRGSEKPNSEIEEGQKSTLLCHLGNISYRTGRTIRFDPAARKILGDPEAEPDHLMVAVLVLSFAMFQSSFPTESSVCFK